MNIVLLYIHTHVQTHTHELIIVFFLSLHFIIRVYPKCYSVDMIKIHLKKTKKKLE